MKLDNEINMEIVESKVKEQLPKVIGFKNGSFRKNNRKRTKGRHTQRLVKTDNDVFPPVSKTIWIKHKIR